jgi:hypothetical protein
LPYGRFDSFDHLRRYHARKQLTLMLRKDGLRDVVGSLL